MAGILSKTRNLCPSAQPKPIPQSGSSPPRGGRSTAHRRVRRRSNRQAATLLPALPSPEDLRPSNNEEDGYISTAAATGSVQHCGNKRYIRMKPLLGIYLHLCNRAYKFAKILKGRSPYIKRY